VPPSSNSNIESTLNANISKEEILISAQQMSLTAELNSANEIMQELPTQLDGSTNSIRRSPDITKQQLRQGVLYPMGSYQEHALDGASAVDLVVALYDGILRFLYAASAAVERGDQAAGGMP
jgi:flagellin-specific chaperone FliS